MNQDRFILDMHVKGKEAENLAQIYFLKNGYHVFNNISQHGCIDLIVVNKDNELLKVDVKSVCRRARDGFIINRCRTELQKKLDVKILYVDTDKRECYFYKEDENPLKRRTPIQIMGKNGRQANLSASERAGAVQVDDKVMVQLFLGLVNCELHLRRKQK